MMIKELIKVANELDARGLSKESNLVDEIIKEAVGGMDKFDRMTGMGPGARGKPEAEVKEKDMREETSGSAFGEGIKDSQPNLMEAAKKREDRLKSEKWKARLDETNNWFAKNVFLNKPNFPITTDKDYWFSPSTVFVVKKGVKFSDLESKGKHPNGQDFALSLEEIYAQLKEGYEHLKL